MESHPLVLTQALIRSFSTDATFDPTSILFKTEIEAPSTVVVKVCGKTSSSIPLVMDPQWKYWQWHIGFLVRFEYLCVLHQVHSFLQFASKDCQCSNTFRIKELLYFCWKHILLRLYSAFYVEISSKGTLFGVFWHGLNCGVHLKTYSPKAARMPMWEMRHIYSQKHHIVLTVPDVRINCIWCQKR